VKDSFTNAQSDLFLVCDDGNGGKYFQIWINNKDQGFKLAQTTQLPLGVQSISFADMGETANFLLLDSK